MGMYRKRLPYRERRLNKRTIIFMLSWFLLSMVTLVFLVMCQPPFLEHEDPCEYQRLRRGKRLLSPLKHSKYILAIVIISGPDNLNERTVIRETWLNDIDDSIVLYRFVVGSAALDRGKSKQLNEESKSHKDMVLLSNVKDTYQDLTFKVLQAFIWLDKNVNYHYALKVDDDSFVVLPGILLELLFKPKERFYWGFFDGRGIVKTSEKRRESNWFLCDKYLPYARGGGYVLTFDLVNFIARNYDILYLHFSEDVSVGTWLAPLKIIRHHDQNFDTEYMSRGCLNSYLVMHKQSSTSIRELYYNLETVGVLCKNETVLRGSYEYNWDYPPSQCCNRLNVKHNNRSS